MLERTVTCEMLFYKSRCLSLTHGLEWSEENGENYIYSTGILFCSIEFREIVSTIWPPFVKYSVERKIVFVWLSLSIRNREHSVFLVTIK